MDTLMYVSNILLLLLPFIVMLAVYLYKIFESKLPTNQRTALDQFVNIAVQMVEQVSSTNPSMDKKALAMKAVTDLFTEFKLPVPSSQAISDAIESSVYLLNQLPKTAPEPLQGAIANTAFQLPAVNPTKQVL